jgi:1-deoxy-D-xylulose-5-phosphate reductoisomerase
MAGATFPAVYNAANEVAVDAFASGAIGFLDIVDTIERVVGEHSAPSSITLESVLEADAWARTAAMKFLSK